MRKIATETLPPIAGDRARAFSRNLKQRTQPRATRHCLRGCYTANMKLPLQLCLEAATSVLPTCRRFFFFV